MPAHKSIPPDEQRHLCRKAQQGDAQALNDLYISMQHFVWKQANTFARRHRVDAEDLAQIGALAVVKSVRYYNPDRLDTRFSTYACRAVIRAIAYNANREFRASRSCPFEDNLTETPVQAEWTDAERAEVRPLLAALSPEDRRAIELRFGLSDGVVRTLAATAAVIGCSAERVRQRIERALRTMRAERDSR